MKKGGAISWLKIFQRILVGSSCRRQLIAEFAICMSNLTGNVHNARGTANRKYKGRNVTKFVRKNNYATRRDELGCLRMVAGSHGPEFEMGIFICLGVVREI